MKEKTKRPIIYTEVINVKVSKKMKLAILEKILGKIDISNYIKNLIRKDLKLKED